MAIREALAWHRHRNSDGIAERVLQRHADSANAERMFLAVIGNAVAARVFEVDEQGVDALEGVWRARLEGAADQCFDGLS